MTGFYCPVVGCKKHEDEWDDDQPPFDSEGGVRGHINAMSDDDHQQARDDGAWTDAPTSNEGGDGEGDESSNEQADDQQNEGDDDPLEEDDQMVSPEEYQEQQDSSGETEGSEGDDDQPTTSNDQGTEAGVIPSIDLPEVPPMYAFAIVAAVFAAVVIWRVMKARSSEPAVETVDDDENSQQTSGHTLIEE